MRKLLNVLKHCSHLLFSYLFPNYRHPLLPTTCHVSRWGSNPPTPLEMWAQCTKAPSPGGVTYQLVNTVISGLFKVLHNFTHLRKKEIWLTWTGLYLLRVTELSVMDIFVVPWFPCLSYFTLLYWCFFCFPLLQWVLFLFLFTITRRCLLDSSQSDYRMLLVWRTSGLF